MLNKFEVSVARDEVEGVDTLRYSFEKLLAQAVSNCIMPPRRFQQGSVGYIHTYIHT